MLRHVAVGTQRHQIPQRIIPLLAASCLMVNLKLFQRPALPTPPAIPLRDSRQSTAERRIKEGKRAMKMTRLGCHRFRLNAVRPWLSVIACNLGNLWRLVSPRRLGGWPLASLQQKLVKTGSRLIKGARYYWLLLAEGHLTRRLFGATLGRIAALSSPAG